MPESNSPRFSLNSVDWAAIGRGALVALAGAAIVAITQFTDTVDFGQWAPIVSAAAAVLVNALRKFVTKPPVPVIPPAPLPPPTTPDGPWPNG